MTPLPKCAPRCDFRTCPYQTSHRLAVFGYDDLISARSFIHELGKPGFRLVEIDLLVHDGSVGHVSLLVNDLTKDRPRHIARPRSLSGFGDTVPGTICDVYPARAPCDLWPSIVG